MSDITLYLVVLGGFVVTRLAGGRGMREPVRYAVRGVLPCNLPAIGGGKVTRVTSQYPYPPPTQYCLSG